MALPIKYNHQVEKRELYDTEEAIESLAELAGFKVYRILDENSNFIGYTLQPADPELDAFINAEIATEKAEAELASCFDCYFEEEI